MVVRTKYDVKYNALPLVPGIFFRVILFPWFVLPVYSVYSLPNRWNSLVSEGSPNNTDQRDQSLHLKARANSGDPCKFRIAKVCKW
jgi:hypothetical protein